MSKRVFARNNWTPTGTADTTNLADGDYMAIKGANSTQIVNILALLVSGLSIAQTPMQMAFAFDSTVATGTLGGTFTDAGKNASISALSSPALSFAAANGTKPQRSATLILGRPSINAFGGLIRVAALDPTDVWTAVGNAANGGEFSLSARANASSGAIDTEITYEVI